MENTHTDHQAKGRTEVQASVNTEISKVGAVAFSSVALFFGLWATTCLFAGTISSGPVGLIQQLFTAISG